MSILSQHNFITRSHTHVPTNLCRRSRIISSTSTTTTTPPKRKQTKLSIEPKIENPTATAKATAKATHIATPILNDPSLLSTWTHRIWVAAGCTTVFVSLAKAVVAAAHSHMWLQPVLAGYIGYILADLGSGVYHWGIDNYGDASTPVFGAQIEAFQGHHKWPWTITRRQFANNLHALARVITFIVLPIDLVCNDAVILGFVSLCSGCIMFSQQFHAWAHSTKSKLPPLVVALQDAGLLVSRSQHADHHRAPYNNNYCIVSGVWNEFLDKNKVFEALEMVFYFQLGVQPRSWSEPNSEWTEDTESTSQVTAH